MSDPIRREENATWTPKIVQERMIEALKWARYNAGPVGPAKVRSTMPAYRASLEDHLAEGWGIPERADDDLGVDDVLRLNLSPEAVSQMIWVLNWCGLYLAKDRPGDARILNLWLRCKVYRTSFDAALKSRGFALSRQHAYRMRDRALSHLSQRLDHEGYVP